jgi:hypothetical protein
MRMWCRNLLKHALQAITYDAWSRVDNLTFKIDFNLKKLSSQLMRLPLTALFVESVMNLLYTRKLFLCLIFLKYTSHFLYPQPI